MAASTVRGVVYNPVTQPWERIFFGVGAGFVFRLNDDRGASGGGDEDVRVAAWVADDGLGLLGAHLASGEHGPQQVAQGVVGAGFGLVLGGHGRIVALRGSATPTPKCRARRGPGSFDSPSPLVQGLSVL